MKRISLLVAAAAVLVLAAPASPQSGATLTIRHQIRGCHTWSVNGGVYRASQSIVLTRNSVLTLVNNDVMPHRLVKVSGPALALTATANMNHMNASTNVRFTRAGVYMLMTKPGEDYMNMRMMKTIGEDNVLKLKVTVR